MHGVRDFGQWTKEVARAIRGGDSPPTVAAVDGSQPEIVVIPSGYGYFPMGAFLILGARQRNVRWFMDEYTEARAQYPRAAVSYIGHSNGTYLLASALERYRSLCVKRVIFAGSVVRRSFNWDAYRAGPHPRVESFRNIVASGDWVVGIFPRLYEWVTEVTPVSNRGFFDVGSAGFRGFTQQDYNVQFVRGEHSAALDTQSKIKTLSDYIVSGSTHQFSIFEEESEALQWVDRCSRVCWLCWLGLLTVLVGVGVGAVTLASVFELSTQPAVLLYVLFVICLLYSV
jgi:pimeloyl-ACP methyl ester carboxylesterase